MKEILTLCLNMAAVTLPLFGTKVFAYLPSDPTDPINIALKYCIDHADRVAAGENVLNDLVKAGLIGPAYANKTCTDVQIDQSWQNTVNEFRVN